MLVRRMRCAIPSLAAIVLGRVLASGPRFRAAGSQQDSIPPWLVHVVVNVN